MTKILNLDNITTKRDKVIRLNGKEHVMRTFTVREYLEQMQNAKDIETLMETDHDGSNTMALFDKSIEALIYAFPSLTKEDLFGLTIEQLTAVREFAEGKLVEEAPQGEATGE